MFDINKEFEKRINKTFCDVVKKNINPQDGLKQIDSYYQEIKTSSIPNKRILKNELFKFKRFINK